MKSQVLIIGGGFAGIYTAKRLLKEGFDVLLISERNYFTFTPLLHEVATGNLSTSAITFEYTKFFHHKRFSFLRGTVSEVHFHRNEVTLSSGQSCSYDYLVIATGATTNFYNIPGNEHSYPLKTIEDALAIKRRIIELAQGPEKCLDVNVIGGGPTGIELIMEIHQLIRSLQNNIPELKAQLRLIHAADQLLAQFPESIRAYAQRELEQAGISVLTETRAQTITDSQVETSAGMYKSNLTIMTAGVISRSDCVDESLQDQRRHIHVNEHLQVQGQSHVYALGDVASMNGEPIPKLAQIATQQASTVAQNITNQHKNRQLVTYQPKLRGLLISLGHRHGAGAIGPFVFKGFFAWWLWRTVYLMKTPGIRNKLIVASVWTLDLFTGRSHVEI